MKNWLKVFGIIALSAAIGFSITACNDDEGDYSGTFTVTGIPSDYIGELVRFDGNAGDLHLLGLHEDYIEGDYIPVEIVNENVSFSMWFTLYSKGEEAEKTPARYSSNNNHISGNLFIDYPDGTRRILRKWENITFSKGSTTQTWNSGRTP